MKSRAIVAEIRVAMRLTPLWSFVSVFVCMFMAGFLASSISTDGLYRPGPQVRGARPRARAAHEGRWSHGWGAGRLWGDRAGSRPGMFAVRTTCCVGSGSKEPIVAAPIALGPDRRSCPPLFPTRTNATRNGWFGATPLEPCVGWCDAGVSLPGSPPSVLDGCGLGTG